MKRKNERKRIREIIKVFIKYGVKEGLKGGNGPVKLRMALEEMGPTFIKIGQILSTRSDILPEAYINEFQKLQDDVRPEKFDSIREIIERELKAPVDELFESIQKVPAASASLAQVHAAVLKSGEKVVIKVMRPGVRETMLSDIRILKKLTVLFGLTPQGQVLNPREVVDELYNAAVNELNFINEADNIREFYKNNKDVKCVTCPRVYDNFITTDIIVMEYIDGIKITSTGRLSALGYQTADIAAKLAGNYLKQVFEDGFFHADPHPGNILVKDNKIVYVDFGMMGTFGRSMRSKFNSFLAGMATRDVELMVQAVMRIGIRKGNIDYKRLYSDIEEIYYRYFEESIYEIDLPSLMDEVFRACRRNCLAVPREITMLMRGFMTLEGVIRRLDPDMNIMDIAVPYVKAQIIKKRDYKQDIEEQLENLYLFSKSGLKAPVKLMELVNSALGGKLKVQIEHTNLDKSISDLSRMINRVVFAIIVASLIVGSSLVIKADAGPKLLNVSSFGIIGYTGAGALGLWLLISIMRSGKM